MSLKLRRNIRRFELEVPPQDFDLEFKSFRHQVRKHKIPQVDLEVPSRVDISASTFQLCNSESRLQPRGSSFRPRNSHSMYEVPTSRFGPPSSELQVQDSDLDVPISDFELATLRSTLRSVTDV